MSAAELDVPLLPSAEQIRRRNFATVRRGFDPDQVRDYLWQLADQIEGLERQLREARMELEAAASAPATAPQRDPYEELASRVADLIRAADAEAGSIKRKAAQEAERLVGEARAEADRVRLDAQAKAEEARSLGVDSLREAREEADRTLAGLASRRESLVEQLQGMQERLIKAATELGTAVAVPGAEAPADRPAAQGDKGSERSKPARAPTGQEILDPSYEDLWADAEDLEFEMPEIPRLDLAPFEDQDETVD